MGEKFKTQMEAKIDSAVDRAVESSNSENEKLEEFKKQAEKLRKTLKASILQDNILDEDKITDDEWQEIFDSLPKDLLAEFDIQQYADSSISPKQQLIYFVLFKSHFEEKYKLSYSGVSDKGFVSGNHKDIAKINFETGQIDWERGDFQNQIKKIGEFSSIDEENGIINGKNGFARIDIKTGKVLWKLPGLTGFDMIYEHGKWVTDNEYYVVKINPETGKIDWIKEFSQEGLEVPVLRCRESIFFNDRKSLAIMDLDNGNVKWKTDIPIELGAIDYSERQISRDGVVKCENGLLKVDMKTGKILWTNPNIKEKFGRSYGYSKEGFVSNYDKKIGKIDLKTGKLIWERSDLPIAFQMSDPNFVRGSNGTRFLAEAKDYSWRGVARIDEQGNVLFKTSDIPKDKIETLKSLGIEWYERFYSMEFIEHIIQNRNLLEQGNVTELQKKPITVVLFPRRDENSSYLHNNVDEFMKSSNVLYFEIENEQEMYQGLSKIKKLGIQVENLVMGGHSTSEHMSFGDRDPAKSKDLNEQLILDFSDESELLEYSSLFRGSNILSTGCSTGEGETQHDNLVNLFGRTLGKEATRIVGAQRPVNSYFDFDQNGNFLGIKFFDSNEDRLSDDEIYTVQK